MLDFSTQTVRDVHNTYSAACSSSTGIFTDLNRSCSLIGQSSVLPCVEPVTDAQFIPQVLGISV